MERHFSEAQYEWTSFFTEQIFALRQRFGDLDVAVILTVMGLTSLKAVRAGQTLGTPISAHSLALATGIPRETVRRKLVVLADLGWIEAAPSGGWRLILASKDESLARQDLADLTLETNKRLALLAERLVEIGQQSL